MCQQTVEGGSRYAKCGHTDMASLNYGPVNFCEDAMLRGGIQCKLLKIKVLGNSAWVEGNCPECSERSVRYHEHSLRYR